MSSQDSKLSRRSLLKSSVVVAGGALVAGALLRDGKPPTAETAAPVADSRATVNILDFGAKPSLAPIDLKTYRHPDEVDNAPAVQRAIDSLPPYDEQTGLGGGVVHVPRGAFMIADTIYLPPGVILRGEGFFSAGASQLYLPSAIWQDRDKPKPIVEVRHPEGNDRSVPYVGIENMEIQSYPRALMYPVLLKDLQKYGYPKFQEILDDLASRILNPGSILCLWRGGRGSFLRNVNFCGGPGTNQTPWSSRYAVVVPPECHAGPSVWDGLCFECNWRQVRMENAHDIIMFSCTWGCFDAMNQPWMEMKNCTGVVMYNAGAETPFHLVAENSQAVIYGAFSGWQPNEPPLLELKNSDVAVHNFVIRNCKLAIRDTWGDDSFVVAGPGGSHREDPKQEYLAFYPGRRAVIPRDGIGRARGFEAD